jgi:hypothetical protein
MRSRTSLLAPAAVLIVVAEGFVNDGDVGPWAGLSLWGIGLTALLLLVALPRTDPSAHPLLAWSFGITALFTCVAFWSALPFAFGTAAVAAARRPTAPAALLGIAALLLATAFCILA